MFGWSTVSLVQNRYIQFVWFWEQVWKVKMDKPIYLSHRRRRRVPKLELIGLIAITIFTGIARWQLQFVNSQERESLSAHLLRWLFIATTKCGSAPGEPTSIQLQIWLPGGRRSDLDSQQPIRSKDRQFVLGRLGLDCAGIHRCLWNQCWRLHALLPSRPEFDTARINPHPGRCRASQAIQLDINNYWVHFDAIQVQRSKLHPSIQ